MRQFRAFDRGGVPAEFAVPRPWQVTTMSAIGRAGDEDPGRARRTLQELVRPGT